MINLIIGVVVVFVMIFTKAIVNLIIGGFVIFMLIFTIAILRGGER